jgi:hypothetical protein
MITRSEKIPVTMARGLALVLCLTCAGCEKENGEIVRPDRVIDAFDYDKWVYLSLESGEIYSEPVESSGFLNSLDWDIAFHRYNFRLNGGASGKGEAGAVLLGRGDLDDFNEAPLSGYVQDDSISIMFSGGMPPTWHTVPGSHYLGGYYDDPEDENTYHEGVWNIEPGTPPIYHPTDKVYALKTAAGKHVIIKFEDYYDEWGVAGYVSLSYKYNADGTNTF